MNNNPCSCQQIRGIYYTAHTVPFSGSLNMLYLLNYLPQTDTGAGKEKPQTLRTLPDLRHATYFVFNHHFING